MLSVVLPTYNEAKNLPVLLERLQGILQKGDAVIVVDDDSPDGTWQVAEDLKKRYPFLRVLRRVGRRGLSSAVTEGFAMARGSILLVMDSDLQHDPQLINQMRQKIEQGADIVVASRYIPGGSVGEWVTGRRLLSKTATYLAQWLPNVHVSDPMSGFFAVKASAYRPIAQKLKPAGFKILLEILAFLPRSSKAAEVPLYFRMRHSGESKLSMHVQLQFVWQLLRIAAARWGFAVICLLIALLLGLRIVRILPLYTDAALRADVETALNHLRTDDGFLLSDVQIVSVGRPTMTVMHVTHGRGPDLTECFRVALPSGALSPCAAD